MSFATRPCLRSLIAMLCVALSLAFAGTSAARVVNQFQHDLRIEHTHAHHYALTMVAGSDHGDSLDAGREDDTARPDGDAESGDTPDGHHHADGPAGFHAASLDFAAELIFNSQDLGGQSNSSPDGWPPRGPERPPRHLTTSA